SDDAALEPTALPLGEPTPDTESLIVGQGVLQALVAHRAALTDLLGLPGRSALLREERLGVGLRAQRAVLPLLAGGRVHVEQIVAEGVRRVRHQTQMWSCPPPGNRRSGFSVRCWSHIARKVLDGHAPPPH